VSPRDDCVSKLCDLDCQYINIHIDNKGVNPINDLYLIFQYLKIFNKVRPNLILAFLQKLADEKAAAVKSNTAYQSKLVKDKLIENLSHPPIQLWVAGSSRGWKCKKGGRVGFLCLTVDFRNKIDKILGDLSYPVFILHMSILPIIYLQVNKYCKLLFDFNYQDFFMIIYIISFFLFVLCCYMVLLVIQYPLDRLRIKIKS